MDSSDRDRDEDEPAADGPGSAGGPSDEGRRGRILTPLGGLLGLRAARRSWTAEERHEVLEDLFFEHERRLPYLKRFTVLILLSAMIAAFGLLSNSGAVVIGAMLVAPLMTPILAAAAALVNGRAARLAESLAIIAGGTVTAIGISWLLTLAMAGTVTAEGLTDQLLARTSPGLLDLGIAVAAGSAAAYILTDRGAASALPGVAIAVALVPPLATVGIALGLGANSDAEGAFLLFLTNLVAIVLSAAVVFTITGFVDREAVELTRGRVRAGLAITVAAAIAVAVPLALHTRQIVEDERFERAVVDAVPIWDPQAEIVSVEADRDGDRATVDLIVASPTDPVPAWRLVELIADREALSDVEVTVKHRSEVEDAAQSRN